MPNPICILQCTFCSLQYLTAPQTQPLSPEYQGEGSRIYHLEDPRTTHNRLPSGPGAASLGGVNRLPGLAADLGWQLGNDVRRRDGSARLAGHLWQEPFFV